MWYLLRCASRRRARPMHSGLAESFIRLALWQHAKSPSVLTYDTKWGWRHEVIQITKRKSRKAKKAWKSWQEGKPAKSGKRGNHKNLENVEMLEKQKNMEKLGKSKIRKTKKSIKCGETGNSGEVGEREEQAKRKQSPEIVESSLEVHRELNSKVFISLTFRSIRRIQKTRARVL